MSIIEMKLEAIKKIADIDDEKTLKQLLQQLGIDDKLLELLKYYNDIKVQYGDVLQKLAQ